MRVAIVTGAVCAFTVVSSNALADGSSGALEVGLRTGYALPLGQGSAFGNSGSNDLDKLVSSAVPLWIDAGYRISPHVYLGAFFQYGIGFVARSQGSSSVGAVCSETGVGCSITDLMFGADVQYHFLPSGPIDPYAGLGVGYEILTFDFTQGGQTGSLSMNGVQLLNLQLGADLKATPDLGVGPFFMLSVNEYGSCGFGGVESAVGSCNTQAAIHEWFTFGVRGAYDIGP